MTAVTKTKMMVSIWTLPLQRFNEKMRSLGLRRDSYLNKIIGSETEELRKELPNRNSDDAKAYLLDQLKLLPRTQVSILLEKAVYEEMEAALAEKNVARDCFINRLVFFLVADPALKALGINVRNSRRQDISVNPLEAARGFLHDPFFDIRTLLIEQYPDYTFYSLEIPKKPILKDTPTHYGLNCYIDDSEIAEQRLSIHL